MTEAISGRQMCERIAAHWAQHHPELLQRFPTPEAIWESSSTGELSQVYDWYNEARIHDGEHVVLTLGDIVVGEWNKPTE